MNERRDIDAAVAFSPSRRHLLGSAGAIATGLAAAAPRARAASDPFVAKSFGEALIALGGVPQPSTLIALDVPAVADNGAVVPVTVSTTLPNAREIAIVVDGNPQPVAARFTLPAGTEPFVATRIKMAGNGTVHAAVRTEDGRLYAVSRTIEVTVGGCG